ncbi:MAG: hypothetical protein NTW21_06560 [Verrucomicrobia bacterium]|nr:hypothetical protein [Verrucomicrobiota bacterium]
MTLPETSTPIVAAAFVGGIGLLGIVAGVVACRRVFAEGRILDRGEDALTGSLPSLDLDTTDPVTWLASNDLPKDSHFGDHLLSVWGGWLGERVPTLAELHSLSARRERRRLSARISGGITALLLICGIAGTLLCIHPILRAFTILKDADGNVVIDPAEAQEIIRSLGSAFLPSLTALVATVLVAILRGMYLQSTSGLAWRLDRFAVDQLFPMFKPKRFGAELTAVHSKLSRLVDRMAERDRDFAEAIGILGKAAQDLKDSGPRLKAASDRITNAADRLANETESMTKALDTHLGENSALVNGTHSINEILGTCVDAANQLREGGTTLATSLAEASGKFETARTQLGTAVAEIPQQIQQGCDLGSKTLSEANQRATRDAATAIAKATEAAALGINSSYAKAGEVFTRAASEASTQAATAIGQATGAATNTIKAEVAPVTQVVTALSKQLDAASISYAKAGEVFTRAATEASNLAVRTIGQAASEAANRLKPEVGPVARPAPELPGPSDAARGAAIEATGAVPTGITAELDPITQADGRGQLDPINKGRAGTAIDTLDELDRRPEMENPPTTKLWKRIVSLGLMK